MEDVIRFAVVGATGYSAVQLELVDGSPVFDSPFHNALAHDDVL
jgi:hypothetical protein